jgi:glutathione-regulated potassium-efflux system ancillary protein KefF
MAQNILVIYAHPASHLSWVNRRLADAARGVVNVQLHDLYETYPDFQIDVAAEQARLASADVIVFLHPIQWYSMPSLLKEWVDTVLQHGWAYGREGKALHGKAYWLVVTTGSPAESYSQGGVHGRPFADYLPQFEQTATLCGMRWDAPYILHGAHHVGDAAVDAHVAGFRQRLEAYSANDNQPDQD